MPDMSFRTPVCIIVLGLQSCFSWHHHKMHVGSRFYCVVIALYWMDVSITHWVRLRWCSVWQCITKAMSDQSHWDPKPSRLACVLIMINFIQLQYSVDNFCDDRMSTKKFRYMWTSYICGIFPVSWSSTVVDISIIINKAVKPI